MTVNVSTRAKTAAYEASAAIPDTSRFCFFSISQLDGILDLRLDHCCDTVLPRKI